MAVPCFAQQEKTIVEEDPAESAARAGETMASLFGPSARMPDLPNAKGSLALPAFDSSNMLMDEKVVNPRGENSAGQESVS